MALIEYKHVDKYYGDYHALRDINLEIEEGQVVVLLGPSGSGKSTLIRTMNALESIETGSLIVNGHELANASNKELVQLRKEVGMVFQHFNLYPHKTVLENVNLDIKTGEFIGIVGLNGSGKSTLLKLILGVNKPTNGKIIKKW